MNKQSTPKTSKKNSAMSLKIDIPHHDLLKPRIVIFGVGGAGGNAINNMIRSNLEGVEFVAANTDAQALANSLAQNKVQLGVKTTKGLGAGSFPDRGRASAEENLEEIDRILEGANMVFIAAGMGGGTGTGAAPVIAKMARERDILTVGVVTKPFHFEGKYRMEIAVNGIEELKKFVDTLIVIPNQNLFRIANEHTTFESAFKMADDVLHAGVRGVTDLITMPGLVNLDFADIRTIMTKMGKAMMGTGEAEGENRAIMACEAAISNPLLDDVSIKGAKGVLVNMTGGPDMTLFEADMAVNAIKKEVDPNANIIFGSAFNEDMKGKIRISVVATGIDYEDFHRESVQAAIEPKRFQVNNDFEEIKSDRQNLATQGYFDPGAVNKIDEIEEVSDINFKPKRTFGKEENVNYGKAENTEIKEKTLVNKEEKSATNKSGFFAVDDEFEDLKKAKNPEVKKKVKAVKSTKKESSGFSLFSFMNSSNDSKKEEENEEEIGININQNQPINIAPDFIEEKFEQEIEKEFESEDEIQKEVTVQEVIIEDPADSLAHDFVAPNQQNENAQKSEKFKEAEKKRRQFFSETIFDEDDSKEEKFDDDILNVPAFFRRKKM